VDVSRSGGYYGFFDRPSSDREKTDKRLMPMIGKIFYQNRMDIVVWQRN
jgi:hypothetical protein